MKTKNVVFRKKSHNTVLSPQPTFDWWKFSVYHFGTFTRQRGRSESSQGWSILESAKVMLWEFAAHSLGCLQTQQSLQLYLDKFEKKRFLSLHPAVTISIHYWALGGSQAVPKVISGVLKHRAALPCPGVRSSPPLNVVKIHYSRLSCLLTATLHWRSLKTKDKSLQGLID